MVPVGHAWGVLAVVDDARMRAGDGYAAWSESFSEMYAQVAGTVGECRGAAAAPDGSRALIDRELPPSVGGRG